jgi:hypothetical protein
MIVKVLIVMIMMTTMRMRVYNNILIERYIPIVVLRILIIMVRKKNFLGRLIIPTTRIPIMMMMIIVHSILRHLLSRITITGIIKRRRR